MIETGLLPLPVKRWTPFDVSLRFEGKDLTGAVMRAQVRQTPDAPGTALIDLTTVTTTNTEGLRFVGVDTSGIVPVSTVQMRINEPTIEGLPFPAEQGTDLVLAWDMHITIDGLKQRWLEGPFTVYAGVTQA